MASIETAYTATQTEAFCDDTSLNPSLTETDGEIHITIQNRDGTITMGSVYDALNAAYATVACNQEPARNTGVFVVSA